MRQSIKGIYLKHFPYSETSAVLKVFTQEYGLQSFIAKGIKKNQIELEQILKEYSGEQVKLSLEITNNTLKPAIEKKQSGSNEKSKGHPLFESIMETFDGEIIRS